MTEQEWRRTKIKILEYWWDWVDSGKSLDELAIMIDVYAAGGRLPENIRQFSHETLRLIRKALEDGVSRNEAIAYLRRLEAAT
jgi:hypothetical protein